MNQRNEPEPYSREVIDIYFKENRDQHDNVLKILQSIDNRVAITNGKVAEISKWKEKVAGGLYVVTFLGFSGFVAIILWWIKLFN